jgi:hypothetical protein
MISGAVGFIFKGMEQSLDRATGNKGLVVDYPQEEAVEYVDGNCPKRLFSKILTPHQLSSFCISITTNLLKVLPAVSPSKSSLRQPHQQS